MSEVSVFDYIRSAGYEPAELTPQTIEALSDWAFMVEQARESMTTEDFVSWCRGCLVDFRDGLAKVSAANPEQAAEADRVIARIDRWFETEGSEF